jgi:hypothetical protein
MEAIQRVAALAVPRHARHVNPFNNIIVNLHASGPAAVVSIWLICVTVIAIFGQGPNAESAMRILAFAGGALLTSLSFGRTT